MDRHEPRADIKTVAEKLECYRMKWHPDLCTAKECPYNNNDSECGYYCCSNSLLYDAVTLLAEFDWISGLIENREKHFSEWAEKNKAHVCATCGRSSRNLGDETRCPIEHSYALPLDGCCHLWEEVKKDA